MSCLHEYILFAKHCYMYVPCLVNAVYLSAMPLYVSAVRCVRVYCMCMCVQMCVRAMSYNTPLPPIGMEITAPIHQVPHSRRRPLCCHVHCLQRHRPRCSDWLHHPQRPCPSPVTIPLSRTSECDTQPHLLSYWECPKL